MPRSKTSWTERDGRPRREGKRAKTQESFSAMVTRNFTGAPEVHADQSPDVVSERRIDSVLDIVFLLEDAQMDAVKGLTQALQQYAGKDERGQALLYGQFGPLKNPNLAHWDSAQWTRALGRTQYGKTSAIPALRAAVKTFGGKGGDQGLSLNAVAGYIAKYGLQKQAAQQQAQPAQQPAQQPAVTAPSQPQQPQQPRQSIQVPGRGTLAVPAGENPEAYRKRMGFRGRR